MGRSSPVAFTPQGATLNNGFELGGNVVYPLSLGLAVNPPAEYSNYIGDASGVPIQSPVTAQASTTGMSSAGAANIAGIKANALSLTSSPLPWVILGLFGAVIAMHVVHYK